MSTDVALEFVNTGSLALPLCDLVIDGDDLKADDGLYASAIVSLFCDSRVADDDEIPDGTDDKRGWWADTFSKNANDSTGSRLWILSRAKLTQKTLNDAKQFAEQALQWMIDDGIATVVEATAERNGNDALYLGVVITKADGTRWENAWNFTIEQVAA